MGWLRVVIRVGVLWLLSIVVAVAGMELAHRVVLGIERGTTAVQGIEGKASAVSFRDEQGQTAPANARR